MIGAFLLRNFVASETFAHSDTRRYTPAAMAVAQGRVSIKDVSRVAEVSVSTVSHVVNGTRFVSPELRQRVERAIERLDYRHNGLARSLRTRQSYAIGLIIPDVSNPYYPQLARGVQDAADAAGYSVFLCNSDRNAQNELRLLTALEQRRVDGAILDAAGPAPPLLEALRRRSFPIVLVGSRIETADIDVVRMAPRGGYEAVRHLVSKGHRRIALIGGPPAPPSDRPAKAAGYLQAHQEFGIKVDPALVLPGDYTRESGYRGMMHLLSLANPPTAAFAGNDLMAIGAMMALHAAGRRVPKDVAVAGYDDIPEAAITFPPLTTVAVPKYEMGRVAAELLLRRLGNGEGEPDAPQRVELQHHLIIRGST